MAGLREELDLDVSAALRQVNTVEAALGSAAKSFKVELAQALDLLRRADTSVTITADAKAVTGTIDAAVQNADTHVSVEADSNLGEVAEDAQDVSDNLGHADRAAAGFGGTLGGVKTAAVAMVAAFGLRAVIEGIGSAVNAASDLAESTSKVRVVFAEGAGQIERFGDQAATSVGLAKQEALEAAGSFGNLFIALGTAREEATRMAPEVVQLGADLASFNNLGVPETLEKLRSGLVGEIEPLRSMGISFNAMQVEAKAAEMGLRDANGEISEGSKVQARYALILEQTKAAQGDFARTSDGLANQQRILSAEMGNLRAEIGEALLPVVLELVTEARNAAPAIKELALDAVPALSSGFRAFIPVGTSTLSLLVALGPVLELTADVIDAIPEPLLQAAAGLAIFGGGLGPMPNLLKDFMGGMRGSATEAGGLRAGFAALNPWVLAGSVALVGVTTVLSHHQKEQRENEAAIKAATAAFRDQSQAITADLEALAKSRAETENQVDDLRRLGLSFEEFAGFARRGKAGYQEFVQLLVDKGDLRVAGPGIDSVSDAVARYGDVQTAVNAGAIRGNTGLLQSYQDLGTQAQTAASKQLDYLVVTEELTASEVKAAEKRHHLADGTTDYVGVLEDLQPATADAANATGDLTGQQEDQTKAIEEAEKAYNDLISALDKYFGRQVSGLEATLDYEQAVDDLVAGLKENGRTLDVNTEKGRANQRQLLDTRDSIIEIAKQRVREGGTAEDAANSVALHTLRLAGELRQAGLTEQQVREYIAALHLTPDEVKTEIEANTAPALEAIRGLPGVMFREAEAAGGQFNQGIKRGMDANLTPVITAARGVAAAAIAAAKDQFQSRSPSRVGMQIGGFFVEGLALGIDGQKVRANNAALAMAGGVADVVREAAKITTSEALNILQAVSRVKDAEKNLADTRKDKKAGTLALRIAELELADARAEVNRQMLESIDATDAATEAMARQKEEAGRLGRELDAALGALDAMAGVRSAQRRLVDAQRDLSDAQARQTAIPGEIAAAEAALARAREQATTVTAREAQAIVSARQQVQRAEEDLASVTADGEADALDREAAALALTIAQEDLTAALAESVAPTSEVERIEGQLVDLREEEALVARRVQEATEAVTDAQLALVDATRNLIAAGDDLAANRDKVEQYFRAIAASAGLSKDAIEKLIEQMRIAEGLAGSVGSGGSVNRLINTVTGRPAFSGPNGEPGSATPFAGSVPFRMPDGTLAYYRPGSAPEAGNVGALQGVTPVRAPITASPVVPITAAPSPAQQMAEFLAFRDTQSQSVKDYLDALGRQPQVVINPKQAIYDAKATVATLSTLELLNR